MRIFFSFVVRHRNRGLGRTHESGNLIPVLEWQQAVCGRRSLDRRGDGGCSNASMIAVKDRRRGTLLRGRGRDPYRKCPSCRISVDSIGSRVLRFQYGVAVCPRARGQSTCAISSRLRSALVRFVRRVFAVVVGVCASRVEVTCSSVLSRGLSRSAWTSIVVEIGGRERRRRRGLIRRSNSSWP